MFVSIRGLLAVLLISLLAGCDFHLLRDRSDRGVRDHSETMPPLYGDQQLHDLWLQIDRVVQTGARSESACRTMPIGAKPCGGPWSHLIYSASTTDETTLRALVGRFNERQRSLNTRRGIMSTCDVVEPPAVRLEAGQCVLDTSERWR